MIESWFPKNYNLSESITLKRVLFAGENWQIYRINDEKNLLCIKEKLLTYWVNLGIEKTSFLETRQNNQTYYYFTSSDEYLLQPICCNLNHSSTNKIATYEDAVKFAKALSNTRKQGIKESLENSIYVEKLNIILPIPDSDNKANDNIVLGSYLTGGLKLAADDKYVVKQLMYDITDKEYEEILRLSNIESNDFKEKLKEKLKTDKPTRKSSLNEDGSKKPFSLPGRIELENFFKDYVIDIVENQNYYKPMGIEFPSPFILQGPSGCGKTYAVEKLTEYLEWPCFFIDSGSIGSSFIHETSKLISKIFQEAIDSAPSVIVIDEMESFLSNREGIHTNRLEEVGEFLRRIPEAKSNNVLVIAMTNMIGTIDSAIKRKGRFDHIIEVGLPSIQEIEMVIKAFLSNKPHDEIDTSIISKELKGYTLADVDFVMRESARITAKNHSKSITQDIVHNVLSNFKAKSDKKSTPGFKM